MNAFIDANGLLISFSYDDTNGDAQVVPVAIDFRLEAGKWRWDGTEWLPHDDGARPALT